METLGPKTKKGPTIETKNKKALALGILAVILLVITAVVVWRTTIRSIPPQIEAASKEKMAFPLPAEPSIAVLPFINMSEDPKQEYLGDGLAEDIINGLSRIEPIFVIARNSSFAYKGKSVKIRQVAEELGVQYVLDGSLRKSGDKVRITAQLIDALTGRQLFSERYDRDSKDVFKLQDEITLKVLTAIQVRLTVGEDARIWSQKPKNMDAYLKVLQALALSQTWNKESQAAARRLSEEAIALDPEYAGAYCALGVAIMNEAILGVYPRPQEALEKALELEKKAVELDNTCSTGRAALTGGYIFLKRNDKALAEAERLLSLAPNSALAYFTLALALFYSGRFQEALPVFEKSLRLSPIPVNSGIWLFQGFAYGQLGRGEEAVAAFRKGLRLYPNHLGYHLGLASAYFNLDRQKEARSEVAEVLRIDPKFSLEDHIRRLPFNSQREMDDYAEPLRKLGLK